MRKVKVSKFPYLMWYWTNGDENLFDLSTEELYFFVLLVREAFRTDVSAYD